MSAAEGWDTPEDRVQDWERVWEGCKFPGNPAPPNSERLLDWLEKQPLHGNFRDLEKIAMYYHVYGQFDEETKGMIAPKSAFEYAKAEFERYYSRPQGQARPAFNFDKNLTTKEMIADYKYELQKWAVQALGGRKEAVAHFKSLGDSVTDKTFNNWKNK